MKHDRGGHNQQRTLGRLVPLSASVPSRRQVEMLGQQPFLPIVQTLDCGIEAGRKRCGGVVRIAQLSRSKP